MQKDLLIAGTTIAFLVFIDWMGIDYFDGQGRVVLWGTLLLLAAAVGVGLVTRKLQLARVVFYVGLTLVLTFALGPAIFARQGDISTGVALVLLVLVVPVAVYFARPG